MQTARPIVLVVDDNEQKRYSISHYLKRAGFEVWEAENGKQALELAEKMPSVIALDVNLPDIIGYDVCRRIRSNPKIEGVPIIHISSTFTTASNKAKGLENGADTYLTGPVDPEELIATVNAMLRLRQAETAARSLAAQWQATFDAISDAVALVNAEGVVERCNKAFAVLLQGSVASLAGRPLSQVAGPSSIDQSVYFRMLGSRSRETIERHVNNRWLRISADPVLEGDTFKGGVLIISDITDRKRAEESRLREQEMLQREAERLEQKVSERTAQLQESVRSMDSFCYTIAHDLRAPLRAVNGFIATLMESHASSFDEDGRDLSRRISEAARRMDQLIQDLLAFGRLSHAELPMRKVDLAAVVEAAWAQLAGEVKEKKAELFVREPLPDVIGNPTLVEQIAVNFLGNSLKFVEEQAPPRIEIRAEPRNGFVRLWFEDNGIGIDPAYHAKIFGLFERLHSARKYGGTGIGLAIAQKGAERMGGAVGVESAPGQGSRFWIELPAARPE